MVNVQDGEAARLNALDAKLKAMEAEDESGVLQQLKASLQAELQQQDDHEDDTSKADEEHDPYGSDFEEEEVVRYRVRFFSLSSPSLLMRLGGVF